jgi:deoxycytidylate deaminase
MISRRLQEKIYKISTGLKHMVCGHSKHFSFLVERNKIISMGWNRSFDTHPLAKRFGHRFNCVHSELDCILNFPYPFPHLSYYTLINIRLVGTEFRMAKPCLKCEKMLDFFGISDIIYSTNNINFPFDNR